MSQRAQQTHNATATDKQTDRATCKRKCGPWEMHGYYDDDDDDDDDDEANHKQEAYSQQSQGMGMQRNTADIRQWARDGRQCKQ